MKYICIIILVLGVCFLSDGISSVDCLKGIIGGILLGIYVQITFPTTKQPQQRREE